MVVVHAQAGEAVRSPFCWGPHCWPLAVVGMETPVLLSVHLCLDAAYPPSFFLGGQRRLWPLRVWWQWHGGQCSRSFWV